MDDIGPDRRGSTPPTDNRARGQKVLATDRQGDVLIVTVVGDAGELNWLKVESETADAATQLTSDGPHHVILDFNQSPYFGSSMLSGILRLARRATDCQGRLIVCNVSPSGRRILDLTKFAVLWPICETQAMAFEMLKGDRRVT
jgi:anti-anti-sigma factor